MAFEAGVEPPGAVKMFRAIVVVPIVVVLIVGAKKERKGQWQRGQMGQRSEEARNGWRV